LLGNGGYAQTAHPRNKTQRSTSGAGSEDPPPRSRLGQPSDNDSYERRILVNSLTWAVKAISVGKRSIELAP
jgi:hypothetical protein